MLFLLQDADLLAAVQIIVYAGAIVVLFLFVIMLLGVDRAESLHDPLALPAARRARARRRPARRAAVPRRPRVGHRRQGPRRPIAIHGGPPGLGNNIERVARVLFTDFLWPFELTAALLVIAVVGAVVLARRSGQRRRGRRPSELDVSARRSRRRRSPPPTTSVLAAMIFTIGAVGVLTRRNVLVMFMCVELMLNAVNLTFVAFANQLNDISGQVIVFFTLSVAAAEVAVGLAIIVAIFRLRRGATADDLDLLNDRPNDLRPLVTRATCSTSSGSSRRCRSRRGACCCSSASASASPSPGWIATGADGPRVRRGRS